MAVHAEDRATDTQQADAPTALAQTRANTARLLCAALRQEAAAFAHGRQLPPPAATLTMALTVLWSRTHKFDAADAAWPDRDRFVACNADTACLMPALRRLSGHPASESREGESGGLEISAGLGGQAIAEAIGMAVAERALAARFGKSLVDHRVWAACDAAALARGGVQEAAAIAGQLKLDRLVVLADAGAPGPGQDETRQRFAALGWATKPVMAEDPEDIDAAIGFALRSRKPTLLWCLPTNTEPAGARITANAREAWRRVGAKGAVARRAWLKRLARHGQRGEFERAQSGRLADALHDGLATLRQQLRLAPDAQSPAALCGQWLERLAGSVPELVSARTEATAALGLIEAGRVGRRILCCGNRPQGLAGCLNGIARHGGLLPLAWASLIDLADQLAFLREAAAAGRRGVTIATDPGGGAQVPELLGWLRGIPNLLLLRPGCPDEAMECLELALRRADGPSVIVAADAALARLRPEPGDNRSARGGYVLAEARAMRHATLLASGAELPVALAAQTLLAGHGIAAAVVSLPCWGLFEAQDAPYRRAVLGEAPRFGLEAGLRGGWERWLNGAGGFFGAGGAPEEASPTAPHVAQSIARRLASI